MSATELAITDEDLVPRLAARDEAAVALLLERWWARAYRLAHQLTGDPATADDAAQEAFVHALRAAGGFDPARGPFAPWFLRIVRNAAFNLSRARARRAGHEAAAARPEVAPDDPAARAADCADAEGLRQHLAALRPPYREAVALHVVEGLTFQEVAQVLGCPLGTVASRVRRGLEALRARAVGASLAGLLALGDQALGRELAAAFAGAPPAPAPAALLQAATAAPPSSAAPARWAGAGAVVALLGLMGAGVAGLALLLHEPTAPPRQVVRVAPPPSAPSGVPVDPGAPARPAGLVVADGGRSPTPATIPAAADDDDDRTARLDAVDAVVFDPSGARAVAGRRDGSVEVWDLRDGTLVHRLTGHRSRAVAVAFSRDGERVASAGWDGTARVWDVPSGECAHVLEHATGERRRVLALALAPDGEVAATAGEDGRVRLWDLATGACLRTLEAHERAARAVAFDPGGATLLTAGDDHRLRTWTRRGDPLVEVVASAGFTHALLDGPGVALVAGAPQQVERFDLVRRERVATFVGEGPLALTGPAAATRDRGLLVRGGPATLRLVDPERGVERARLDDPGEVLLACDLSADGGRALTGAESGRIKLWDLRAPDPRRPAAVVTGPTGEAERSGRERVVVVAPDDDEAGAQGRAGLPGARGVDVEALRRELRRARDARRREIAGGLDPTDPAAFQLLLEVLASAHVWTVRLAAAEAVAAQVGDPRVLAEVDRALTSAPDRAREGLAWALGLPRSQGLGPRLVRLLGDPAWEVRRAAAVGLGRAPDARAVVPLVEAHGRERAPDVRALLDETLEALTGAAAPGGDWTEWLLGTHGSYEVRRAPGRRAPLTFQVDQGPLRERVTWSVRVRGQGPPLLVLPQVGYRAAYLEPWLRGLEDDRTVVYVDPSEAHDREDAARTAFRLARLRAALVGVGVVPDAPEVVVAHGLSAAFAAAYPAHRPGAGGLVLVAPLASPGAWSQALRQVAAAAERDGHDELLRAARVLDLARGAAGLQPNERVDLRAALFTSHFADRSDLLIGHLLGPRTGARHSLEWADEPSPPGGLAARPAGWHAVPTLVLVDRGSPWTVEAEAARLAGESRRGRVAVVGLGGGALLLPSTEVRDALRALGR